jgi:hypothetical protein
MVSTRLQQAAGMLTQQVPGIHDVPLPRSTHQHIKMDFLTHNPCHVWLPLTLQVLTQLGLSPAQLELLTCAYTHILQPLVTKQPPAITSFAAGLAQLVSEAS